MVLSDSKKREFIRRLLLARMRILCNNGFYGLLLMHVTFALDDGCPTASTDGERIYFGPEFLDKLTDKELDFVMMHEILHIVLDHCFRARDLDRQRYNIAADIVVNSNILKSNGMDTDSISIDGDVFMHLTPKGNEGYNFTAEQVYEMISSKTAESMSAQNGGAGAAKASGSRPRRMHGGVMDDHSRWRGSDSDELLRDLWVKRFEDACEAISVRDAITGRGMLPLFAKRKLTALTRPQIDWREALDNFVQEEVTDYSFMPPDKRFSDSDFFLPDYNEKEDFVRDILFMIDSSGSVSDSMLTAAYSEVRGAIEQFGGRLRGKLGYFEAGIVAPVDFDSVDTLIPPVGGGGTDFSIIFEYVKKHMSDCPPVSIIIITDGLAPFPPESSAMGIPVLWLISTEKVVPPWGKYARITA